MAETVTAGTAIATRTKSRVSLRTGGFLFEEVCRGLEHGGLGISSENRLKGFHDLPLGRVDTGAVEQRIHEVLVAGSGFLQPAQSLLDVLPAPAGLDRAEPIDLLALERGIDAQDRQRRVL